MNLCDEVLVILENAYRVEEDRCCCRLCCSMVEDRSAPDDLVVHRKAVPLVLVLHSTHLDLEEGGHCHFGVVGIHHPRGEEVRAGKDGVVVRNINHRHNDDVGGEEGSCCCHRRDGGAVASAYWNRTHDFSCHWTRKTLFCCSASAFAPGERSALTFRCCSASGWDPCIRRCWTVAHRYRCLWMVGHDDRRLSWRRNHYHRRCHRRMTA